MTSEWAQKLVAQKKEKLAQENTIREKELSDRKLLTASALRMWDELRQAINQSIRELNEAMGEPWINVLPPSTDTAVDLKMGPREFYFLFSLETWRFTAGVFTYQLVVIPGKEIVWKQEQSGSNFTSEQVAKNEIARIFAS